MARVLDALALALIERNLEPVDSDATTRLACNTKRVEADRTLEDLEKLAYPFTVRQDRKYYLRGRTGKALPRLPPRPHVGRADALKEILQHADFQTSVVFGEPGKPGYRKTTNWRPGMNKRTDDPIPRPPIWSLTPSLSAAMFVAEIAKNFPNLVNEANAKVATVKVEAAIITMREAGDVITAERLAREVLVACGANRRDIKDWF